LGTSDLAAFFNVALNPSRRIVLAEVERFGGMKHILLAVTLLISSFMQTEGVSTFAKFEPLYRAGKPLEEAIQTRPNLVEFAAMLRKFETELSIAKDKALSPAEKALVSEYDIAYQSFRDAEFFWKSGLPPTVGGRAIDGKIVLVRSWECVNPPPDTRKDKCPTPNPRIEEPVLHSFIEKYTLRLIQEKKPIYSRSRGKEHLVTGTVTEASVSVAEGILAVIATGTRQLTAANNSYLSKV
jgi:hypothetical protein